MNQTVAIDCPAEILLTLHMNAEGLAGFMKEQTIDERIGRNMAELLGLSVVGTLGVLLKAKDQGFIPSFYAAVTQMRANGIFYHPALVEALCRMAGESS